MQKIDCMEDYYCGTRAYYLNFYADLNDEPELKKYIVEPNNIIGANVSLISIILLGIKEDLVLNKGELKYESKLFFKSLENAVEFISRKKDDKYFIDGYEFPDAASIVAIIRNKFAHGRYTIDFDNNNVILNHKGIDIKININKLTVFIIAALKSYIIDIKTDKYIRDFCAYTKPVCGRTAPIKKISELKNIIRNMKHYTFELTSENGTVPQICIDQLEIFILFYRKYLDSPKTYQAYKNLEIFFKKMGCRLKINSKKINNEQIEKNIINYSNEIIIGENKLDYEDQIVRIGTEMLKLINSEYKTSEPIFSNAKLLFILDAIKNTQSTNDRDISLYLAKKGYPKLYIGYDEIGTMLINMFNTLFIYGFDDVYTSEGGYKLNREDEFDFSKLNIGDIKPIVDGIDYNPLNDSKLRVDSLNKKIIELSEKINIVKSNLNNVKNKKDIYDKISKLNEELEEEFAELTIILNEEKNIYSNIFNDYTSNINYFKNKAIINGIRNSIAHGHYQIIAGSKLSNAKIIFNDIYNGELTFKVEMTFEEFSSLLEDNFKIIFDYINKKNKKKRLFLR